MRRGSLLIVGLLCFAAFVALAAVLQAFQPPAESSLGSLPLPPIVGMTGDGHVLTSGVLSAAEHEAAEGYFSVQTLSISVPPKSIPATELRNHLGADVEIIIRRRKPRELETVSR